MTNDIGLKVVWTCFLAMWEDWVPTLFNICINIVKNTLRGSEVIDIDAATKLPCLTVFNTKKDHFLMPF